jgi:hypothetical protein
MGSMKTGAAVARFIIEAVRNKCDVVDIFFGGLAYREILDLLGYRYTFLA